MQRGEGGRDQWCDGVFKLIVRFPSARSVDGLKTGLAAWRCRLWQSKSGSQSLWMTKQF